MRIATLDARCWPRAANQRGLELLKCRSSNFGKMTLWCRSCSSSSGSLKRVGTVGGQLAEESLSQSSEAVKGGSLKLELGLSPLNELARRWAHVTMKELSSQTVASSGYLAPVNSPLVTQSRALVLALIYWQLHCQCASNPSQSLLLMIILRPAPAL